jgi:hypothetical protein
MFCKANYFARSHFTVCFENCIAEGRRNKPLVILETKKNADFETDLTPIRDRRQS